MRRTAASIAAAIMCCAFLGNLATAGTTVFFENCQVYTLVTPGVTSDTIRSHGYLFTYTRDKLFTGGTGQPIGRPVRVAWPAGLEAQAVTTPPPGVTDHHARITLSRVDGQPFDLTAFTFQLLANTGGAGASIEIMPLLNGQDGLADPVAFDATGYYGMLFSYDGSPNPQGSTALLRGFDTYKFALYVDFALIGLTLDSVVPDAQACCLSNSSCADQTASDCALQGGTPLGVGTNCACNTCSVSPGPPPIPDGRYATVPLCAARLTASGDSIEVTWDSVSCPATDSNLIYGDLSSVADFTLSGAVCSIGTSGDAVWDGVPPGNLCFLMVGTDGAGTESSWGLDGANHERNQGVPSGVCGVTTKNASGTCP